MDRVVGVNGEVATKDTLRRSPVVVRFRFEPVPRRFVPPAVPRFVAIATGSRFVFTVAVGGLVVTVPVVRDVAVATLVGLVATGIVGFDDDVGQSGR
ncbi:hypothetical protein ACFQGT_10290 [Natrialbaceae archaeon GCM10025810]|uniref:hypothetical protein n=1 Tax=Halovalidus salilacus TaxID=3075124 RepID=UPI00360BA3C4